MTYGLFSLDSGNALDWYDSADAAFAAARRIAESEPAAIESLGLVEFDENGHSHTALQGQALLSAASGVAA